MVFYQKLRAFHWMVKGPQFLELHAKFEELYDRWAEVIDELAERCVQLGGTPPLTLAAGRKSANLQEVQKTPDARHMVEMVLADLTTQQGAMRKLVETAEEHRDRTTVNLVDSIVDEIEKTAWMLRAYVAG